MTRGGEKDQEGRESKGGSIEKLGGVACKLQTGTSSESNKDSKRKGEKFRKLSRRGTWQELAFMGRA